LVPGAGGLAEWLEPGLAFGYGDARAVVFDHDENTVALRPHPHPQPRVRKRVARCVYEQVLDDPLHLGGVHVRDHRLRVQIDGSIRGSELTSQTEVVSGSVTVTTNPAQYGFTASAGQCVQQSEVYDSATFQYYTAYSVGSCL